MVYNGFKLRNSTTVNINRDYGRLLISSSSGRAVASQLRGLQFEYTVGACMY